MLLQQIHSETIQITYLSQSLESLNVVIAFLMSAGGNKDMSLGDFMVNKLEMKRTVHSSRVRKQHCNNACNPSTQLHMHILIVLCHTQIHTQEFPPASPRHFYRYKLSVLYKLQCMIQVALKCFFVLKF